MDLFSRENEKLRELHCNSWVILCYHVAPLISNGSTYTDPVQQATVLKQQFETVFSRPKVMTLRILAELERLFQCCNPKKLNNHQ